jgi:hypothetical protein
MSPNRRYQSLFAVVLSLAFATQTEAQSTVGVRANGMGGAFVGVADDASAVYWNPAGLATGLLGSVDLEIGGLKPGNSGDSDDIGHGLVGLALPPVGLAYYRQGVFGEIAPGSAVETSPDREEVRTNVHAFSTSTVAVSLLHSLGEYVVVSATPKMVWGGDSFVGDIDASMMMAITKVRLGLVGRNLTTPEFEFDDAGGAEAELASEVRVGAGWGSGWPGMSRVVVAVDGDLSSRMTPTGDRRDVAAGVETWWWSRRLGVRGGVRGSTEGESRPVVSAGASAMFSGMYLEGYYAGGESGERSWGLGLRYSF